MGKLIGLSGWATSGKDTAAEALIEDGFTRVSFADKMREVALALDPIVDVKDTYVDGVGPGMWSDTGRKTRTYYAEIYRLNDVVGRLGWTEAKEIPEVRRTLQRLGTEVGRNIFGEDFWVNLALDNAPEGDIVITDVRYPNEAEAIRERGGEVWRIGRPGVDAVSDHPSETSLDNYPFNVWIWNDGTIETLHAEVREFASFA